MKAKLSSSAVGMFVLGALVLGIVAYLSFGGANVFSKPSRFLMYFNESVSGLDPGAAVKLNGVRIGRVAAINVRFDAATKKSLVQTVCEVDRNILTDSAGQMIDMTNPVELQTLIDRGLRARLNLTGITGLLFVELDFEDARQYPADPRFMTEPYPVVPAITSAIAELQQSIVEIVSKLKQVDFQGLEKELKTLLATTTRKVNELDVKALAERVGRAADSVQELAGSPEAKQTFANLNAATTDARTALGDLRGVLAKVDAQIGPTSAEFAKTLTDAQAALKSLDAAAASTRQFVQAQSGLGEDVTQSLRQVADAAAAITRLADFLERNPNALLVGKKPPQ